MEDQINNQIEAAEKLAALYDEDDRPDIKTDVMNSFYAGIRFAVNMKKSIQADTKLIMADLDKFQVVTESDRNHIMVDILIELERLTVLELVGVLTQLKIAKVMGED